MVVRWPNGSEAKLFGAHTPDDVERLRSGGNRCCIWAEELAAWRYIDDAWDHMRFGLRLGPRPHWVGSTTPKPKQLIKDLAEHKIANVAITTATTNDNPYLIEDIRTALFDRYSGTSLGAQELEGRLIDEDENALWTREVIERNRAREIPRTLHRISVGVDPSGGQGEQGIVAVGRENIIPQVDGVIVKSLRDAIVKPHGFVLADYTTRTTPAGWGKRAVQCAVDYDADNIAVEINFGGDMAVSVIKQALDHEGLVIPVKVVRASRGKRPRAEPVAALTSNGRMHHIGVFERLESQMCTWTPDSDDSPDRMDAMVWGAWQTKLASLLTTVSRSHTGFDAMSRRIG
jgi:phage terminase large subunit-like protein